MAGSVKPAHGVGTFGARVAAGVGLPLVLVDAPVTTLSCPSHTYAEHLHYSGPEVHGGEEYWLRRACMVNAG